MVFNLHPNGVGETPSPTVVIDHLLTDLFMLYIAERSTQPGHLDVIVKMSCAMPTSRAGGFIDELAVLEAAGDARQLEGVRQLIMRGMKLTGFKPACVSRLQSLTVRV